MGPIFSPVHDLEQIVTSDQEASDYGKVSEPSLSEIQDVLIPFSYTVVYLFIIVNNLLNMINSITSFLSC